MKTFNYLQRTIYHFQSHSYLFQVVEVAMTATTATAAGVPNQAERQIARCGKFILHPRGISTFF